LEEKSEKSKVKLGEVRVPTRVRERLPLERSLGSVKVTAEGKNAARVSRGTVADANIIPQPKYSVCKTVAISRYSDRSSVAIKL
jgi:hypothetical protein